MMMQAGVSVQLITSTNVQNPLSHRKQQDILNTPIDSNVNPRRLPNLPTLDLLTGPRGDYLKYCLPLYEASIKCDWKAAKAILEKRPELVRYSITENGETALHVAASAKVLKKMGEVFVKNLVTWMEKEVRRSITGNHETTLHVARFTKSPKHVLHFVKNLVDCMTPEDLELENKNFNTAFYLAAVAGNLETIKIMVEKHNALLVIPGAEGKMLPLYAAAACGNYDEVKYLYEISKLEKDGWTHRNRGLLLEKCVENDMFDVALQIVKKHPELDRGSVLGILARKPDAFSERKPNTTMLLHPKKFVTIIGSVIKKMVLAFTYSKVEARAGQALQLLRFILDDNVNLPKNEIDSILMRWHGAKDKYSSEALFTAAEMGNTIFVVELIRRYPDIMWKVNDNNQTIFHIAVENRHEGIYTILYEIGYMNDSVTSLVDKNGNNMLHLVAKIAKKKKLEEVPGVIFQMQRELLWFKEVKSMINLSCIERKNIDGLTAQELFTKEHEDLLAKSVKWVKGTANQCMVVAALVATIAFAAAITIPGGYKQDNGIPIFYRETAYTIFILADAASLVASSTSTVLFITILTSRFAECDFLEYIPSRFTLFLSALFLSILAMMVSFSVSFFLIYNKEMTWIPIIICMYSVWPILLYVRLQYGLFEVVFRSMYGPRYLFKPKKHVLYYQNPVL